MKLKDYFKVQNNYHIDDTQKFLMYEKILSKQYKNNSLTKRFFSVKSFAYGFMSVIILIGLFVTIAPNDISYDDFVIQNSSNIVSADYIANVIEFNGTFYVAHEDKIYRTNKISNGDSVVLKKGSEIVFNINSGTQTKLVGPARFTLSQNDSGTYQLMIAEGDYIQIESNVGDQMEIVLGDDITISNSQNIDLLITKTDDEYKINNQGDQVKITTNNKTKQLESKQLLAIKDNDIRLIENAEDFRVAFTQQSISQTFQISEEKKTPTQTEKEKTAKALIDEINTNEKDNSLSVDQTKVAEDLGIADILKIPTTDQSKTLYSVLDKSSLMWTLESLYKAQVMGDTKEYSFYVNNLSTKIQTLAKSFDVKLSRDSLSSDISSLKVSLESNYHIPSTQLNNLVTLKNWITYIQGQVAGSASDSSQADQAWTSLVNALPSNLIFN